MPAGNVSSPVGFLKCDGFAQIRITLQTWHSSPNKQTPGLKAIRCDGAVSYDERFLRLSYFGSTGVEDVVRNGPVRPSQTLGLCIGTPINCAVDSGPTPIPDVRLGNKPRLRPTWGKKRASETVQNRNPYKRKLTTPFAARIACFSNPGFAR